MKKNALFVAAGLMILATACSEDDTIKPSYGQTAGSSGQGTTTPIADDSVYTVDGVVPIRVKISPVDQTQTPKSDVMPVTVISQEM